MITWYRTWPLLILPTVFLLPLGLLPDTTLFGGAFGGGIVREHALNSALLPLLPADAAWQVIAWFGRATAAQETMLYALIVLNVNALMLPILYGAITLRMRFGAWYTRSELEAKRKILRHG